MSEEIESRFREEHLKELRKYSIGELIEAIEQFHVTRKDVDRHKVMIFDHKDEKTLCGGFCVVFIIRDNLGKDQLDTIKSKVSKE